VIIRIAYIEFLKDENLGGNIILFVGNYFIAKKQLPTEKD